MAPPPATGSSGSSSNPAPKILLAKPPSISESNAAHRRPPLGSLNLLSDTWDLLPDRLLPFLTENTDFTVIGVIGPTGVGKSTILNAIYDGNQQSGMLPPFPVQTEETRALARHCSVGLELRVSHERLILLDTQPMFSTSILMDMMRPDGTSTVSLNNSEALSADLVHEMMCIQIGVFLASICHVLLVVSEGVHDVSMWKLMTTVDLLKHGIPDPSSLTPSYAQGSNMGSEKENKDILQDACVEYLAAPVFVHTKLREQDPSPHNTIRMKKMLSEYFRSSSFARTNYGDINRVQIGSSNMNDPSSSGLKLFLLPNKSHDDSQRAQYESYATSLGKLRDQVLSMNCQPFAKPVSEREWLRNSARVWDTVKNSPVIAEYCKMLQNSEPVFTSEDENSDIESQIPEISQSLEDHSKEERPKVTVRNLHKEPYRKNPGPKVAAVPTLLKRNNSKKLTEEKINPDLKDAAVPMLLKRDDSKELTEEQIEWLKDKELIGSQKKTSRRKRYSEMSFKDLS